MSPIVVGRGHGVGRILRGANSLSFKVFVEVFPTILVVFFLSSKFGDVGMSSIEIENVNSDGFPPLLKVDPGVEMERAILVCFLANSPMFNVRLAEYSEE